MNIKRIADVLVKASQYIPESSRAQLCFMFTYMIGDCIRETQDTDLFEKWKTKDAGAFLHLCKIKASPALVPANIRVKESLLSEFCNKWLHVEQFRRPEDDEWQSITSDMNSLRVTMVSELMELVNRP